MAEIHEQQAAASTDPAAAASLWRRAGLLRAQAGDTAGAARCLSRAVERYAAAGLYDDAQQSYDLLAALAPAQPGALAEARSSLDEAAAKARAKGSIKAKKATDEGTGKGDVGY